jgi:nucleoside-diphosphate-sugar epimerase
VTEGIDIVFHLAAIRITQCAEEPRLALEVLVDGTFNVLEAAVKAKVEKVIASSSSSVYEMADRFPTAERHHPYNNRTIYGAAKAFNEGLLRSFNDMYDLKYARCATSTSMDHGWTSSVPIPKCSFAGWNGLPPARRRLSSATGCRPWTSSMSMTSRCQRQRGAVR